MPQDSFHASKRVCHLMKTGVAAIFGPQSPHTASHVQSICDTMEVSSFAGKLELMKRIAQRTLDIEPCPDSTTNCCCFACFYFLLYRSSLSHHGSFIFYLFILSFNVFVVRSRSLVFRFMSVGAGTFQHVKIFLEGQSERGRTAQFYADKR